MAPRGDGGQWDILLWVVREAAGHTSPRQEHENEQEYRCLAEELTVYTLEDAVTPESNDPVAHCHRASTCRETADERAAGLDA